LKNQKINRTTNRKSVLILFLFLLSISTPAFSGISSAETTWTSYRHDNANTGYTDSDYGDYYREVWRTSDRQFLAHPAVGENEIYAVTNKDIVALNRTTGEELWTYHSDREDARQTASVYHRSSPALSGGKVYAGLGDGYLYCLDARTGDVIWEFQNDYRVMSSPQVHAGRVFCGGDNSMYAFNAKTGERIWKYDTGDKVVSTAAVVGGKVIFGSLDHYIYAVDEEGNDNSPFPWEWGTTDLYSNALIRKAYSGGISTAIVS